MEEILWSDHSNDSFLPVLSHGATCFSKFYKMKFGIFFCRILPLATFGSEGVKERPQHLIRDPGVALFEGRDSGFQSKMGAGLEI